MSLIRIQNLSFAYPGGDNVFTNFTCDIDTNWRLGLVGRNGRGKTTLLKLLTGTLEGRGLISVPGEAQSFPCGIPNPSMRTDDILFSTRQDIEEWELLRELNLLEVPEHLLARPFSSLSGGEQSRALLAALFAGEQTFACIDEPTNHLDRAGRELVAKYLARKQGFILVSHDRKFLDRAVDHLLVLTKTGPVLRRGTFSQWREEERLTLQREAQRNTELQGEIRRLEKAADQTAAWSGRIEKSKRGAYDKGHVGRQAARMMQKSKNVERRQARAIEEKQSLLQNLDTAPPLVLHPLRAPQDPVFSCTQLVVKRPNGPEIGPVTFQIARGEIVALCGSNGCGKTTILDAVCGTVPAIRGDVHLVSGTRISRVPQLTSHLTGTVADFSTAYGVDRSLLCTILRHLGFSRDHFSRDMRGFSEGQKKKVVLAASLCDQAHLYIWDEALNYLDIESREQIEDVLREYRPTMLIVEHDAAFLEAVGSRNVGVCKEAE